MRPVARLARLAVLVGVALVPVAAPAAGVVAPEPFFAHDSYRELRLSPSGKYLGALVPSAGRVRLAVIELDTKSTKIAGALDGYDVGEFEWVNDERLVFTAVDLQSGLGEQRGGGLFAANRDGSYFRILAPTVQSQINSRQFVYRYTQLLSLLHDGSDDILVISNEKSAKYPDVYRVNTQTGRKTLKSFEKPGNITNWVVDRKGAVRAAVEQEKGTIRVFWRPEEEANWVQLGEFPLRETRFEPVAFDVSASGSVITRAEGTPLRKALICPPTSLSILAFAASRDAGSSPISSGPRRRGNAWIARTGTGIFVYFCIPCKIACVGLNSLDGGGCGGGGGALSRSLSVSFRSFCNWGRSPLRSSRIKAL